MRAQEHGFRCVGEGGQLGGSERGRHERPNLSASRRRLALQKEQLDHIESKIQAHFKNIAEWMEDSLGC